MNHKLGDRITVSHKLVRKALRDGFCRRKEWVYSALQETDVIVIGVRILSNGVAYWDSDCGWEYYQREHFKALLVCESLHKKPFYVRCFE